MNRQAVTQVVAIVGVSASLILTGVTVWTLKSYRVASLEGRSPDRKEAALEAARWQVQNNVTTCETEGGKAEVGPSPYRPGAHVRYCTFPGGEVSLIAALSQRQADEQLSRVRLWER